MWAITAASLLANLDCLLRLSAVDSEASCRSCSCCCDALRVMDGVFSSLLEWSLAAGLLVAQRFQKVSRRRLKKEEKKKKKKRILVKRNDGGKTDRPRCCVILAIAIQSLRKIQVLKANLTVFPTQAISRLVPLQHHKNLYSHRGDTTTASASHETTEDETMTRVDAKLPPKSFQTTPLRSRSQTI
ncbi:hypothetical protein IWX92DRAFT_200682 [Phyllosticta citricarpa]